MKRIIIFILVALTTLGLYSDTIHDSVSMSLLMDVKETFEVKLSETSITSLSGFNGLTSVSSLDITDNWNNIDTMYILVKSNLSSNKSVKIMVKAISLENENSSSFIKYDVGIGDKTITSKRVSSSTEELLLTVYSGGV